MQDLNGNVTVIFSGVPDTAKVVEVVRAQCPFQIVKVHEQRNLVAIVFSGFESDDPDGYFTAFANYFGGTEVVVRVADGNIFA